MAVPNTTTFTLQDVVNEISPTTNDLVDCFADAKAYAFDDLYKGSLNSLLNFRNYDHSITLTSFPLGTGSTSALACADTASTHYIIGTNLTTATAVYTDAAGTTLGGAGYYSDGAKHRFWNGTTFTTAGDFC